VLQGIGAPQSAGNIAALVQWQRGEGGSIDNPLNTTTGQLGAQGSAIKGYGSESAAVAQTVATLKNGRYEKVLKAFQDDEGIVAIRAAIIASPWAGSGHYAGTDYAG